MPRSPLADAVPARILEGVTGGTYAAGSPLPSEQNVRDTFAASFVRGVA